MWRLLPIYECVRNIQRDKLGNASPVPKWGMASHARALLRRQVKSHLALLSSPISLLNGSLCIHNGFVRLLQCQAFLLHLIVFAGLLYCKQQ